MLDDIAARIRSMIVVAVRVEQREVELELARKVLVQHWLGDPGPLGDVVHRGGVVALRDEDLLRRLEQLLAPGRPRQAHRPACRVRTAGRGHGLASDLGSAP